MKIRTGFVSNSSSSSFIVEAYKFNFLSSKQIIEEKKTGKKSPMYVPVLTPKQMEFLNTHTYFVGSKPMFTRTDNPHQLPIVPSEDGKYYYAECVCNQYEIMVPLLKNKIPFTADWHYGHETVIYCGGSEMIFASNYGVELAMYCRESIRKAKDWYKMEMGKKPIRIVKVKDYLKEHTECNEE